MKVCIERTYILYTQVAGL